MLIKDEIKLLLKNRFPTNIELSFGKCLQRKVQSDLYMVIPRGKKCALWFTYYEKGNACIQVDIDGTRKASNFHLKNVCFKDELAWGTILVGTILKYKNKQNNKLYEFFTLEHIKYYKGEDVSTLCFEQQLKLANKLFENDLKIVLNLPNFLTISMPIIKTTYHEAYQTSLQLPYEVFGIKFWNLNDKSSLGDLANNIQLEKDLSSKPNFESPTVPIGKAVFYVKSNLEFDSYSLYGLNNNKEKEFIGLANIPDYKTSVMMNKIFRKIKENENLDLLEESDCEDEFENISEDKYVDLNKIIMMNCIFLPKFKAWKPISIANINDKVNNIPKIIQQNKSANNFPYNKIKPYSSYKIKFEKYKKINKKFQQINSENKLQE